MSGVAGSVIDHRDADSTTAKNSKRGGGHGPLERVTVNLVARAAKALHKVSELTGDTKTDSINRAIQVYAYLEGVTSNGGAIYISEAGSADVQRLKLL